MADPKSELPVPAERLAEPFSTVLATITDRLPPRSDSETGASRNSHQPTQSLPKMKKQTSFFQHLCQTLFLASLLTLSGFATNQSGNLNVTAEVTPVSPVDPIARNKAVIIEHHERLNRGEVTAALQNYAANAKNHGRPVNREGLAQVLADIYATFPDWRMEIVEIIATEDSVVVRCKVSGTHKGVGKLPINGGLLVGVEPTGKHFEVQHIHWYKLKDGMISDHRANRDDIGMLRQLGLLPTAPPLKIARRTPPA